MHIRAHILLALFDSFVLLCLSAVWVLALPQLAFAYVDPSVMTYTIQALAGVAVALSAVFGVFARKTRKWLMKLLDIDENSKRTKEAAVHRTVHLEVPTECTTPAESTAPTAPTTPTASTTPTAEDAALSEQAPGAACGGEQQQQNAPSSKAPNVFQRMYQKLPLDKRSFDPRFAERLIIALFASALCFGTILLIAPLEIVGGSAGSLIFSLADVWWVSTLPALGIIVLTALLLSLLRGRVFLMVTSGVAAVGVSAYIQTLCLNIGVPIANGDTIVWYEHATMMTVCAVVWSVIIVSAVICCNVNRKRSCGIIVLSSACLLVVQLVGVASLVISPKESTPSTPESLTAQALAQTESISTEDGLFTVSSNNNVIVFVLDTFDTATMKSILRVPGSTLDAYAGFTCFTNVTGSMIPTHYAIPALITGELPHTDESFKTYVSQRYARSTFLDDLEAAGYSIGLYSDSLDLESASATVGVDKIVNQTINVHGVSSSTLSFTGTLEALWQMALYRDLPWGLKPLFWYYTDQINKLMVNYDPSAPSEDTVYIMDDLRFYNQLCSKGLVFEENTASGELNDETIGTAQTTGAFRFIHMLGSHYPYNYNETAEDLGTDKSTMYSQSRGSLYIVGQYLDMLRELGVYDSSTIIITGDHGKWFLTNEPLTTASCPILLVKPAQSAEEAQQPLQVSDAPVSHANIHASIMESIGLDYHDYGESVWDVMACDNSNRVRYYYTTNTVSRKETAIVEYAITGDAGIISNWQLTGISWNPNE